MAEDADHASTSDTSRDAAAEGMALAGASRAKADAYLDEQTRLARLQAENLIELNAFELSHLRWRRFNDQMKGAMQIMLVAVGALIVFAIAAAVWSAAHDDGVVIEAFDVPPDMAQHGLTGSVVSSMLFDRLTALQSQIDSARAPSSYASKGDDIKVLIPDTGISISEAYRYLVGWLGHQTHISGDIYRSAKGIVVVVRTNGNAGELFEGNDAALNSLMDRAADSVYRQTQPFRYGVHLLNTGHFAEADKVLGDLALNGPASEKPWAYAVWMYTALVKGDMTTGIARAHEAAALDPHNLLAQANASEVEASAGHDEQELHYDYAAEAASVAGGGDQIRQSARVTMEHQAVSNIAEETGDFPATLAQYDQQLNEPDFVGSRWSAVYMKAADLAKLHDVTASRHALGGYEDAGIFLRTGTGSGWNQTNFDLPQFEQFAALDDWAGAHKDIALVFSAPPTGGGTQFRVNAMPLLALAQAKTGDIKAAWATIGKLPLDCYLCLRVRGQIAGVQRNWSEADRWFARAVRFAPSIPFAYTEWGATLLSRGRYDAAIVKFKEANAKGPHFADPFEMWGEALTRENRSDLALAKFAEAVKYAPHWGRLHLKWGEALFYAEQKNEAKKQFAIAATLDLSQAEKSELARALR